MGRGDGVEIRPKSIRLFFVDGVGQRCRETLTINGQPMMPTPANIAFAHRLSAKIRREIDLGTFNLAVHFPDSPRAGHGASGTFGDLADRWLASKGGLAPATLNQYRNAVQFWKRQLGADRPLEHATHEVIASVVGRYPWPSPKLRNNYLIALRGTFSLRYRGRLAVDNPMAGIDNGRVIRRQPDPLTMAERDRILADMRTHYDLRVWAYFSFAFFTGMRPEEIIALRWGDIDWQRQTARVQRVRTFQGSEREGSKTHTCRDVDLVPAAVSALQAMKPYTFLKRTEDGQEVDLFENPVTRRHWHDERAQRDTYWKPSLKRLGIRYRRAYCTRHTYCTAALMAGIKPAYIAAQAGHSVKMLLETYARWIPGGDDGTERARLVGALSPSTSSPEVPQARNDGHA